MKMYPDDWRVRLTTGVVVAACLTTVKLLWPAVGFWPWMLAVVVGIMLGWLAGRLLFGPPSDNPPDHPPRA